MRARTHQWLLVILLGPMALGCKTKPVPTDPFPGPVSNAEFGVFYGGQVQERERIPLIIDQTKQSHGIRIDFAEPTTRELTVAWELDMPGTTRGVRDERGVRGRGRLVKHDQAVVPKGRVRFDQVIGFDPDDPLGMWNIRVRVEDRVVIDRAFEVHRPDG